MFKACHSVVKTHESISPTPLELFLRGEEKEEHARHHKHWVEGHGDTSPIFLW